MRIIFSNIGHVRNLDFELKRGLTLFCGGNNTGKTYTAYAIFSILSRLAEVPAEWLTEKDITTLFEQGKLVLNLTQIGMTDTFLKNFSKHLSRNLASDFDAPKNFFGRECIRITELTTPKQTAKRGRVSIVKAELRFGGFKIMTAFNPKDATFTLSLLTTQDATQQIPPELLAGIVGHHISEQFAQDQFSTVHVLTAERAAINLFSRELSSSRNNLVDQLLELKNDNGKSAGTVLNLGRIFPAQASRYSLPIRKGLEIAEDLKNLSRNRGDFADFADKLEKTVLGGQIQVGEFGELTYTSDRKAALRINLAASMIKSLASLVVYLRFQAKKGSLLIVDEPELNLHPDKQRKLAQFLCELTNAGLDIIISTHSDYIIREINHAILLNHSSMAEVRTRYAYAAEHLLAVDKVSVVMFGNDGSPKQLPIDGKGFSVESIDEEIDLQNQIAQDIEQAWQE